MRQLLISVISQTQFFFRFCSMRDPGAGDTETNKELAEQRASKERQESSITWVKSARKEKARLPSPG